MKGRGPLPRQEARYYPGHVSRSRRHDDIDYDDGEKEMGVEPELIKSPRRRWRRAAVAAGSCAIRKLEEG